MFDILAVHWNVDPVIFHIGRLGIRWYSLLFISGFILGWYIFKWFFKREGVSERLLDPLLYTLLIATIVGARLGHCLFYQPDYYLGSWSGFWEIFQPWKGGLASHGGAIALILAMVWFARRYGPKEGFDYLWIMDHLCIAVAFAGCFIRLGNLFNSEIYGDVTSLPWGFIFERNGETVAKHPTQLYESLSYFLIFGVSLWYYIRKKGQFKTGTIFGWWLVALFGVRLLIEFVKNDQVDFEAGMVLNMGQILSLPFIMGGLTIAWLAYNGKLPQGPFPKGEKVKFNNTKKKK